MTNTPRQLLAVGVALCIVGGCSRDDDPSATGLGEDAVGWCLEVPLEQGAEVTDLPRVGCDEPHTHEVYAVFESDAAAYPGFDALETEAQVGCFDRFEEYIGISAFDSKLFYSWMVPSLASWEDTDIENSGEEPGDREIVCIVGAAGDEQLDGSLRDSRR